jgi:hypothetical protein
MDRRCWTRLTNHNLSHLGSSQPPPGKPSKITMETSCERFTFNSYLPFIYSRSCTVYRTTHNSDNMACPRPTPRDKISVLVPESLFFGMDSPFKILLDQEERQNNHISFICSQMLLVLLAQDYGTSPVYSA